MQVIVDSLVTNYEKTGKGRVVVMLHGWGDNLNTFTNLQKTLSEKYQVVSVDLPGFGGTVAPKNTWGLGDYVKFIKDFLVKIEARDIYAFVGHSNGGAILIHGIGSDQLQAEKLILLASAGIRSQDQGKKTALKAVAKIAKVIMAPLPKSAKEKLRKKAYGAIGSDMFVAPHMRETFKKVVAADVLNDAQEITIPVLLIYGDKDESTPVKYGEMFKSAMQNSRLEIILNVGHFIHTEAGPEVSKLIMEFL